MKGKAIAIALVLVLVVVAAGCGSKKKSAASGTTTTAAATTTAEATTTEAATTTTTSGGGGGGTPSFASAKNCAQLASLGQKFSAAITAATGSGGQADLDKEQKLFKQFADAAPSDVRGDFETIAAAFSSVVDAFKKSGYTPGTGKVPSAEQLLKLESAAKEFSSPKLQAAEQHLTAWAGKNCGAFTSTN